VTSSLLRPKYTGAPAMGRSPRVNDTRGSEPVVVKEFSPLK
jgi:hypothetical protein